MLKDLLSKIYVIEEVRNILVTLVKNHSMLKVNLSYMKGSILVKTL